MPQIFVAILLWFIMNNQVIKRDVFDIVKRLKSIDTKYFVIYNFERHKFEVHYARAKNTYELTIPYDTLDARTINFVLRTRIQNRKKIFEEIENSNKKLEQQNIKNLIEKIDRRIYES